FLKCLNVSYTKVPKTKFRHLDLQCSLFGNVFNYKAKNIQKYGYPVEVHEVGTDDGYVLDMQRIPHGPANERSYDALPVLILHGLGSSSAPYVILSNGIAYTLVNEGYDVWLGNFRCSFEDTRHVNYSHWQNKFWNFGLDEYGLSDTPAMIDHILQTTNRTQLTVISLSMSTLTTTALLAFKPEYNTKESCLHHCEHSSELNH
uniref:Partial AB-hydrolase lipase domain-containing protein n=1 Tax=Strigamia maritima TaxID=126957 RepID=T1IGW8_STRMM